MDTIINVLITNVMELIIALASAAFSALFIPWLVKTGIPWLKEKRVYGLVKKFVGAAEKQASAGTIDKAAKKKFVVGLLEAKGITITTEIDAFIEAAVIELDIALQAGTGLLADAFEIITGEVESTTDEAE